MWSPVNGCVFDENFIWNIAVSAPLSPNSEYARQRIIHSLIPSRKTANSFLWSICSNWINRNLADFTQSHPIIYLFFSLLINFFLFASFVEHRVCQRGRLEGQQFTFCFLSSQKLMTTFHKGHWLAFLEGNASNGRMGAKVNWLNRITFYPLADGTSIICSISMSCIRQLLFSSLHDFWVAVTFSHIKKENNLSLVSQCKHGKWKHNKHTKWLSTQTHTKKLIVLESI